MGFFKDFKDDFSQAVNELMPADDNLETSTNEDDVEVNTLEGEVDVETELSKLDGLLEQVTKQEAEKVAAARSAAEMAARNASAPTERAAVPVPASVPEPERNETVSNITKATQEERKMADNTTAPVTNNQSAPVSDEVSVITEGTIIKGDIDVQGPVVVDTSAVVMGNIKSRSVQINNGAVIEGFCSQCYSDVDVQSLFNGNAQKGNE